ncbi:bifunctional transaldolase/phosoglucose isomerase [bacterium]|nr:bifunctional transaldolase/phosoglucose isomerase [bacterium]MBP9807821.1 bifunctional transaldolase/phosoglucose isomerase [bacterium]
MNSVSTTTSSLTQQLPASMSDAVSQSLLSWTKENKVDKIWQKDATLWTNKDEAKWLDWLHVVADQQKALAEYEQFAKEIKEAGFTDVLLLGMGGSSLAPEVFAVTYGSKPGYPRLRILDSTDPQQIRHLDATVDLKKTLFVVSSKSGSTLEPNIYMAHFLALVKEVMGEEAGSRFVAITDPGSKLATVAKDENFRRVFWGYPGIGGRYSALSPFGIVPAALIGLDLQTFLARAQQMTILCQEKNAQNNPGVLLGTIMGVAAKAGRNKLTIVTSAALHDFGAWLEQLVAESTGKLGKAIIPVDLEGLSGNTEVYGDDRLFAFIKLKGDNTKFNGLDNSIIEERLAQLVAHGHPVVTIELSDKIDLADEFFRFEIATAVAGAIIEINPFDQPDVEASKIETRELTDEYEKNGSLPAEKSFFEEGQIKLFSDDINVAALEKSSADKTLVGMLKAHLDRLGKGDYFALLNYIEMSKEHVEAMQKIRLNVRDQKHVATCLGFGPRFLHSTGQAYKGGPDTGVVLQLTCEDSNDLAVPGQKYSFGVVKSAQARGDFQVLTSRKRRALRVHISGNLEEGLKQLSQAVNQALATE